MRMDLRSDTVTRPTQEMWEAMRSAPLGDDVFRDDPTALALEQETAELLGMEAGLWFPTGTQANQVALRLHTRHGDEILAHQRAHICNYESGAQAALAGLIVRRCDHPQGLLDMTWMESVFSTGEDPHLAPTRLVCLENTHNGCGGRVLPLEAVRGICDWAQSKGLARHLDGARLFNAAVASGVSPAELTQGFDTVSVCLSKGLGAPAGSVLCGSHDAMRAAIRYRKMYGGGLRQVGILAAAGRYALAHHRARLSEDHRRAKLLASALQSLPGVSIDPETVDTNLVYFELEEGSPWAERGAAALVETLAARGLGLTGHGRRLRAVTHLQVTDDMLDEAVELLSMTIRRDP